MAWYDSTLIWLPTTFLGHTHIIKLTRRPQVSVYGYTVCAIDTYQQASMRFLINFMCIDGKII